MFIQNMNCKMYSRFYAARYAGQSD